MATPTIQNNFRIRKSFSKISKVIDIPNLIRQTGDVLEHSERAGDVLVFRIRKA